MKIKNSLLLFAYFVFLSCSPNKTKDFKTSSNLERAAITLDSLYKHYAVDNTYLLRENYPFDENYRATYLTTEEQANGVNQYSYLWAYSGVFSAVNSLFEVSKDKRYHQLLDSCVLVGLEEYFDKKRFPSAYSSYINSAPKADRYYDDNIWIGINFIDLYRLTNDTTYLKKAEMIWEFVCSGIDEKSGEGIYWCEQKKESKNCCSNAPASVYAFKLFETTGDSLFFYQGKELYEWTKKSLQDSTDLLYFDRIMPDGKINKAKYPYNSGQMMQSAALQYKLTKNPVYLKEARNIAQSCHNYFFSKLKTKNNKEYKVFKDGNIWFNAVMLRGFAELYELDRDKTYINTFMHTLDHAWVESRNTKGLFNTDLSINTQNSKKWLLTQAAMVEMYSRLENIK